METDRQTLCADARCKLVAPQAHVQGSEGCVFYRPIKARDEADGSVRFLLNRIAQLEADLAVAVDVIVAARRCFAATAAMRYTIDTALARVKPTVDYCGINQEIE